MIEDATTEHFDAIRKLLEPYREHRAVERLPSMLFFVIQAHLALPTSDEKMRMRLLVDLDSVTSIVGKIGDVVPHDVFEKIKYHYAELQLLTLAPKKSDVRGET